jgi:phosphatidyl-myo-inositol dimannoside synthase
MRMLVVTELYPPVVGGSAVLLHEVYSRVTGHDVTVMTDPDVSRGAEAAAGSGPRILWEPLATREWGVASLRGDRHHLRVARRIRSLTTRTDLVHCARALPEGVAAWMNHLSGGAPYLCWSHGEDVTMARTSREYTWVMARVFRGAAAILANSANTRDLVAGLGVERRRIHVVYPGVDTRRFHAGVEGRDMRDRLLAGGDTLLVTVGRLQRRKGHDQVIAAMRSLRETQPGLRYAVVGDGDERARLEGLVADYGLGGRVTFTGAVPWADLPAYVAAADLVVMPNRDEGGDIEGFGMVFLEAAACGKPSIGGNSGGVPEAIEHERTGLLVDGRDEVAVAAAIGRLAADATLRDQMGRAGRARVLAQFTWDQAATRVAAIHDGVRAGRAIAG